MWQRLAPLPGTVQVGGMQGDLEASLGGGLTGSEKNRVPKK